MGSPQARGHVLTSTEVHTYCRVCEPACGLVATVADGDLVALRPDREHPVTRGFACSRGLAGVDINRDPDRLDWPQERVDGELVRRTWDDAIPTIGDQLQALIEEHGPSCVAVYIGNPAGFNSLLGTAMPDFLRRLGVTRKFTATTQDCANKFAASAAVFGSTALHPLPDVRHADVILQFGANWRTSKASIISLPNAYGELMAAKRRGASIYFIDPRRTESAGERTGTTVAIAPDTDVYLLAAMLCEIDRTTGFRVAADAPHRHLDELRDFVRAFQPERVAPVCGVPTATIIELARTFADAGSAAAYMSTGVNMGRQGTLAYWLMHMLCLVTDNLDRIGGNIPGDSFYDVVGRTRSDHASGSVESEFGNMRDGDLPGGLLADYVLDAADPIRALVVVAGNPLLSIPGEERLREAFASLDLLVTLDIYPSATSEYAHWVLPATDQFEREDIGLSHIGIQFEAHVQRAAQVVAGHAERREEWWVLARLAQHLGFPSALDDSDPEKAKWRRVDRMLEHGGLSRDQLAATPHGIQLGSGLTPGRMFQDLIHTADGAIDCCPDSFEKALDRCHRIFSEIEAEPVGQLKLISRRNSRSHNSWYANVAGAKSGRRSTNRLGMHSNDATRLSLNDGDQVRVTSAWGAIDVELEIDETLRSGVVSLEHGWGEQPGLRLSRSRPGVNVNVVMPHGPDSFDPSSNQQHLTGVPVTVERRL